jgi:hypothetical protein
VRQQQGKFTLFDLNDFAAFLKTLTVHRTINLIQDHHTFIPSYKDFNGNNHFERLRAMEEAHLQRGFSEIAQNLTIFPDGTVAVCRAFDTAPAGIKGANIHGLCLENLGDFDVGKDTMTAAQQDAILQVNALLCQKFNLMPSTESIVYHHWFDLDTGQRTNGRGNTKTCPGTGFFGGNTVSSAQANFIPLIDKRLAGLAGNGAPDPADALFSAQVTAASLNVRSQPDASSDILGQLSNGTVVQVFEEQNGWGRIDATDSRWVKEQFLQKVDAASR